MIPTTLPMSYLEVVTRVNRETNRVKLWDIIVSPPITKGTNTVMLLWMQ